MQVNPRSVRRVRLRLSPDLELVEVFDGDLAIAEAVKEMIAQRRRKVGPLDLRHDKLAEGLTEGHTGQFFLEALLLSAVRGMGQPIGQLEERDLLAFFRLETAFDQIDDDAVRAGSAALGERLNTPRDR